MYPSTNDCEIKQLHLSSCQFHSVVKMSAFARTVTPFLRSAQSALQGSSVSPLQHALRRQNGAQVITAWRTYATAFTRDKPHVNIGMNV
jgi:hypothetical protein